MFVTCCSSFCLFSYHSLLFGITIQECSIDLHSNLFLGKVIFRCRQTIALFLILLVYSKYVCKYILVDFHNLRVLFQPCKIAFDSDTSPLYYLIAMLFKMQVYYLGWNRFTCVAGQWNGCYLTCYSFTNSRNGFLLFKFINVMCYLSRSGWI